MGKYITSEDGSLDPGVGHPPVPGPGTTASLAAGSNFSSSDCGSINGSASGPPLRPGEGMLAINGNTDLSGCVVGNSNANASQIYVIRQQNYKTYEYLIWIFAQGPEGAGSGNMWLQFEDETRDHYKIKIHSSTPKWHFVQYNSKSPGITKVEWSDSKP